MEPIHAELLHLATELEAVKGQVQTGCNALRDLFARTTTALSSLGSQHDRRLNHREAGRHLPQQFGGKRLDYGDFAFRMEGYAAVLSRDGQGGALLREDAKLEKFEDNTVEIFGRTFWDVQQLSAAVAAALITCTPREVATLVRRILSVSPGDGLQAWFAVTRWFKPRSVVEQAASMARLISPKRTKNTNELQVAVMQWELTLVENESKFSEVVADIVKTAAMRAMLPNMCSRDSSMDLSSMKNFEIACLHMWERSWLDKMRTVEHNPWTLDRSTSPKEKTKMSMQSNCVVRTTDPIRSTSKSPTTSENPSTVGLPTRHHQRHANRLHETRNPGVMRRNRVRVRRSVSSATGVVERVILPGSADQRMIVRTWMKSEQSRPAMLSVICLVWIGARIPLRP